MDSRSVYYFYLWNLVTHGRRLGGSPCPANLLDSTLEELTIPALQPQFVGICSYLRFFCPSNGINTQRPVSLSAEKKALRGQSTTMTWKKSSALLPWDGTIDWSVKGPSVFDDTEEELDAATLRPGFHSQRSSDLWIFQYGLRYIPGAGDLNLYRTVKVEQLPGTATVAQVLAKVHGEVYSACLSDTSAITGWYTAVVVFVSQRDALEFVFSNVSGLRIEGTVAKPSLVCTPTYPMSAEMRKLIAIRGHTRCIAISHITGHQVVLLNKVLDQSACRLYVESRDEAAGTFYIRFHTIKMASMAYALLNGHPHLAGCEISFYKRSVRS